MPLWRRDRALPTRARNSGNPPERDAARPRAPASRGRSIGARLAFAAWCLVWFPTLIVALSEFGERSGGRVVAQMCALAHMMAYYVFTVRWLWRRGASPQAVLVWLFLNGAGPLSLAIVAWLDPSKEP